MKANKVAALACSAMLSLPATAARADELSDLKARFDALQRELEGVKSQLDQVTAQQQKQATESRAPVAPIGLKPNSGLTFEVGGGEVQLYGHVDVSVDDLSNGLQGRAGAVGKNGWLSQVSSNLSRFGIRGHRELLPGLTGLFQFETEVAYSSTPGPTSDAQVKQGLGSRNSFVGLQGGWGAVKVGKTDAPYKTSTARMDPFSASIGDYNSILGNSGGDNRAEFDTRVPHAVWYESPKFSGFQFNVLVSPGQNRSTDNSILPRGEPVCAGGNGEPCGDGSFGTLWSVNGIYTIGPLYATLAYEHHSKVNRTGDELGATDGINPPVGAVGIADESAWKAGVQYVFPTRTTLNLVYEHLHRNAPVAAFNERSRNVATWVALTQKLTPDDDINVGWAHAGRTPGDPGAATNSFVDTTHFAGPVDNASNLYTVGYKHFFDARRATWYVVLAEQKNHQGAHYDLGASGHGVVVDCKDATGNCFAGATLKGVSVGLTYDF